MSEESSNNKNNNAGTNIIIWLAGIMILVVGAVFLLGENEDKRNKKKAECESTFIGQAVMSKYGMYSSEYRGALEKCIKSPYGTFNFP
tara:strand:- start:811 stop:1074 length:264 start_codon:yes stop_codon:yes gene_type:complete